MTSPDGITDDRTSAADNLSDSVTYDERYFVAVSVSGVRQMEL
jgi:hypothetical protein